MDKERIRRAQTALQSFVYLPTLKEDPTSASQEAQDVPTDPSKPSYAAFRPWSRPDLNARLRTFKVGFRSEVFQNSSSHCLKTVSKPMVLPLRSLRVTSEAALQVLCRAVPGSASQIALEPQNVLYMVGSTRQQTPSNAKCAFNLTNKPSQPC